MKLTPLIEGFVLHCGEMGSRWGINRTVGQVYALLFVSPGALSAEEICERLGISRSNASVALRELEAWRLVRREHRCRRAPRVLPRPGRRVARSSAP
ncbi:MAG: MarR family transcriptional regulator [Xanthomonadales bacterium]|nr:MarR family transcriptional regulator [Xanthomonadales bacterium]